MHCALERRIRRYGSTGRDPERGGGPYAAAEEVKKQIIQLKAKIKREAIPQTNGDSAGTYLLRREIGDLHGTE